MLRVGQDDQHWGPDWNAATAAELAERVRQVTASGRWVIDGNYQGKIGTVVWEHVDTAIANDGPASPCGGVRSR